MTENDQTNLNDKAEAREENADEISKENNARPVLASEKQIDEKKRKRGNRWGLVLTLAIFVCVVIVLWQLGALLIDGNVTTFAELVKGMNGWYLLAAVGIILFVIICDVLKYTLLNGNFGCKLGLRRDIKLGLTGKYYEAITPTATGGQPMQILYMHKQGVSGGKSSSVVLMKYAVQMFAAAIVGAIVMGVWGYTLYNVIENGTVSNGIFISGWIGFAINACAPVFVTFVIFCPRFLKWVINLGLVLLHKMHIVKHLEERRERIYKGIDDFAVCSQFLFKHPIKFLQLLLLCLVEPICINIIPYFILMAFCGGAIGDIDNAFFTVVALSTFATYAVVYIPTPGNSGALEAVFMLAFASISNEAIFWVAIICRFFSYYIYIVMGLCMNAVDLVNGIITRRRQKRSQSAAEQTEEQITPTEEK